MQKASNISNLLTLVICLFNILYDDHYVNKYDVSDSQLTTVDFCSTCELQIQSMLQMETALIDQLIKKTSVLAIIKRESIAEC